MEFLRSIVIFGIMIAISIPLTLTRKILFRFFDKIFSFPIFCESNTNDNNKNRLLTYEWGILYLNFIVIVLLFPLLFISESNYFFNLGVYLVFVIPSIMLLCRIKTFGEDNILPETGLGYEPGQSWALSLLALMWGLMIGFSGLNFPDIPIYISLITIILAIISSMIPMFPDYINKILPYEIRTNKGIWTLRVINVVTISIQGVIFLIFSLFIL